METLGAPDTTNPLGRNGVCTGSRNGGRWHPTFRTNFSRQSSRLKDGGTFPTHRCLAGHDEPDHPFSRLLGDSARNLDWNSSRADGDPRADTDDDAHSPNESGVGDPCPDLHLRRYDLWRKPNGDFAQYPRNSRERSDDSRRFSSRPSWYGGKSDGNRNLRIGSRHDYRNDRPRDLRTGSR